MSEQEAYPLEPEHIRAAQVLRLRTRRLAHLGTWPMYAARACIVLLLAIFYRVLYQLPLPETVGPEGMILFWIGLALAFGLSFFVHRTIYHKLRHVSHLEAWPKPRGDFLPFWFIAILGGVLVLSTLGLALLRMMDRFYSLFLLWFGLSQILAALDTQVKHYAVNGIGLLLGWGSLMALPAEQATQAFFPFLILADTLATLWGWREWRRFRHEAADVR
jgi:hypothetical protein